MRSIRRLTWWWRSPSIYSDVDESIRHATWLELFFDLVFVVAVAELGVYLHDHQTMSGVINFAALFALVWWIWLDISYYADVYNTDDPVNRLIMVVIMFGAVFLSQTIDEALHGGSFAFGAAFLMMRVPYTMAHLRSRHLECRVEAKPFINHWIGLQVMVTVVWALSLVLPEPQRFGLWIAAFVISTAGITVIYLVFEQIEAQVSHFSERLGLFTILVLGETILAVAFATSVMTWNLRTLLIGGLGFLIAVTAWWLYFARFDERVIDWAIRGGLDRWLEARQRGIIHIYAHYPIHGGIVMAGVGIAVVTEALLGAEPLHDGGRWALTGGVAAFLIGSAVCHRMSPSAIDNRVFGLRLAVAAGIGSLAVHAVAMPPLVLLGSIAGAMVGLGLVEALLRTERSTESSEAVVPR